MAACALAHGHDCSHRGWEYEGEYCDWFEDVVGINGIPGAIKMHVYLWDGKANEVTIVNLSTAEVEAAANLVGYLDYF